MLSFDKNFEDIFGKTKPAKERRDIYGEIMEGLNLLAAEKEAKSQENFNKALTDSMTSARGLGMMRVTADGFEYIEPPFIAEREVEMLAGILRGEK